MENKEKKLDEKIDELFKDFTSKVNSTLNILVIGKVSSGKSSFLNAFFDCEKNKPKFQVGAEAGVTTETKFQMVGNNIKVSDTPGLDDINKNNSEETLKMIKEGLDIGILILSGAADETQRTHYEDLMKKSEKVFIVLNKSDEFSEDNLKIVITQWKEQLNTNDKIYPIVSRGYDKKDKLKDPLTSDEFDIPVDEYGRPKTLQKINPLRDDILLFLETKGKDLILAKELKDKSKKAIAIVVASCISAGSFALLPGSAIYIGATQSLAIASLAYLYTGKILSKTQTISLVGVFAAETIGTSLFLIIKSFLPPTGILDLAAAIVAIAVTATMLLTIVKLFENGYTLENSQKMKEIFAKILPEAKKIFKTATKSDLTNKNFYMTKLLELLKKM